MENDTIKLTLESFNLGIQQSNKLDTDMKDGANFIIITPNDSLAAGGHHELTSGFTVTVYCAFDSPVVIDDTAIKRCAKWNPTGVPDIPLHSDHLKLDQITIGYTPDDVKGQTYWRIQFDCSLPVTRPVINLYLEDNSPEGGSRGGVSIGAASVGKIIL